MSLARTPKEVKRVKAELEAIPEKDRKGCVLQELTMFECDRELAEKAGIIKCYPIPRVFRVCPERPAIEVTSLAKFDEDTGKASLPEDHLDNLPQGRSWKEIQQDTTANQRK